jgi:hypothetical protein
MERPNDLPLSFAQERLWFLDEWDQGSVWYNVPLVIRLSGLLHADALERSLATVVQRHEVLRTTFKSQEGYPVQVIAPAWSIQVPVIDLGYLASAERDRQISRLVHAEAQCSFDLANGPLLRVYLLRLVPQEHILLFTLHHIVCDGWSMGVLVREMTTLYQAEMSGGPDLRREARPLLPDLPIQYADYALWQRQWLQGELLDRQLAYWLEQLAGAPALLELPTDRPRPTVQEYAGAQQSRILSRELLQQLKSLSQQENVTLFMTLLAAFNVLLYHYTGQDDLVVGTDVANRNQIETEHLIGFFVNQLVLRTDLTGNPSFLEVMKRVRKVCLEAYAHQDLPFERLVKALPERDLSHTPLFQVKFVLQNVPVQESTVTTLTVRPIEFERGTSKFDLLLNLSESHDGLSLWLEYRTELFNAETMIQFLQQFERVIRQIVALPETRLDELKAVLAAADKKEGTKREQELQQVSLQKLERVRRHRTLKKPHVNGSEEIS